MAVHFRHLCFEITLWEITYGNLSASGWQIKRSFSCFPNVWNLLSSLFGPDLTATDLAQNIPFSPGLAEMNNSREDNIVVQLSTTDSSVSVILLSIRNTGLSEGLPTAWLSVQPALYATSGHRWYTLITNTHTHPHTHAHSTCFTHTGRRSQTCCAFTVCQSTNFLFLHTQTQLAHICFLPTCYR